MLAGNEPADHLHTGVSEDDLVMRRIGEFGSEVLTGEMQIFVHFRTPAGAIADIVDNPCMRDPFGCAPVAIVAAQLTFCNGAIRDVQSGQARWL